MRLNMRKMTFKTAKKRLVQARIFGRKKTNPAPVVESPPAPDVAMKGGGLVNTENAEVGALVQRGPDWAWGEQDGGNGGVGVITKLLKRHEVASVRWEDGKVNKYRVGREGKHDIVFTLEWEAMGPEERAESADRRHRHGSPEPMRQSLPDAASEAQKTSRENLNVQRSRRRTRWRLRRRNNLTQWLLRSW